MKVVNTPSICWACRYRKYEGMAMVGTDATGGGPERSYSCEKNSPTIFHGYFTKPARCPHYEDINRDEYLDDETVTGVFHGDQ